MSWINFLISNTRDFPDKVAVIEQEKNRSLTYKELNEEINRWANYLSSINISKGDRVVFIDTNCLEHITIFLACSKIGAIFVPMNWRLGNAEKEEIIQVVSPKVVLSHTDCKINMHGHTFKNINEISLSNYEIEFNTVTLSMDEPLLMLFTSGSTGAPKGVLQHGEMLLSNQIETVKGWNLLPTDKTIVETPFFHTGGYNVLMLPLLYLGGTVVIASKFSTENFFETVVEHKLTVYFGVPTMFQEIASSALFEKTDLSSLRFLVSGGAYCPVELIQTYQNKDLVFKQGFGLTEVGPNCFLLEEKDAIRKIGSIGKPMPHSDVKLISEGTEVTSNTIGELVIAGPHVCSGYYNNEAQFQKALHGTYFRTGDLATKDNEGYYFIVGRIKDMYISGGENVYPAEVEKRISSHPDIDSSIVVPVKDEKWGEVGLAFYSSKKKLDLADLRTFLNPLISRYKHPAYIEKINEFPLLDNGKINRNKLKQMASKFISEGER